MDKHADCYHIMAGDFNFECNSTQQGYKLFNNQCSTYNLQCMDKIRWMLVDINSLK